MNWSLLTRCTKFCGRPLELIELTNEINWIHNQIKTNRIDFERANHFHVLHAIDWFAFVTFRFRLTLLFKFDAIFERLFSSEKKKKYWKTISYSRFHNLKNSIEAARVSNAITENLNWKMKKRIRRAEKKLKNEQHTNHVRLISRNCISSIVILSCSSWLQTRARR